MIPIDDLLRRLQKPRKGKGGWTARCPAHDDRNPSLSVSLGDDGRILLHCHAGCSTESVLKELGLSMRDLMPQGKSASRPAPKKSKSSYASEADAEAAVLHFCGAGSTIAGRWEYLDKHAALAMRVLRIETPRGKSYRPVHQLADGRWALGDPQGQLPLYRLNELQAEGVVLVAEGEKCADELVRLGYCATTSSHGANSARRTDWSPLAGRDVVILPDNDKPGRGYAKDVATLLSALTPPASVRVLDLPALGEGQDIADFVRARASQGNSLKVIQSELQSLLASSEPWAPDASGNASSAVPTFVPFPIDALPEKLAEIVRVASRAIGCDESFVALPMLAVLGCAIGNSAHASVKSSWSEPPILWVVLVAPSGQQKSPVFDFVTGPARERQRLAIEAWRRERQQYEVAIEVYERDLDAWKDGGREGAPPTRPEEPVLQRFTCDDITLEALVALVDKQPRSLLNCPDELAAWFRGFDQYRGGKGADAARWLSIFGARPITNDRKSTDRGFILVPRPNVCIVGGTQPGILAEFLGSKEFQSGLAARLLFTMPPIRRRRWTDEGIPEHVQAAYRRIVDDLYALPLALDATGAPQPRLVPMDAEAKREWVAYFNRHAEEQLLLDDKLCAAWSKLEGVTVRFALIIQHVRWAAGETSSIEQIDAQSMRSAIAISESCGGEIRRVYAALRERDEDRDLRLTAERIRALGGSVTIREWQRKRSQSRDVARESLQQLVDAGLARWERDETRPTGGHQTERLVLLDRGSSDTWPSHGAQRGQVSVSEVSEPLGEAPADDSLNVGEEEVFEGGEQDPASSPHGNHGSDTGSIHDAIAAAFLEPSDTSDTDTWPPASPPEGQVSDGGGGEPSSDDDEWEDA